MTTLQVRSMSCSSSRRTVHPSRISAYTEQGRTFIGLIKPADMLLALSSDPVPQQIAVDVERKSIQMIDDSK